MKAPGLIFGLLVAILMCLSFPRAIRCQTEKLDIVQYTPPKGWAKTPKEGAVVFVAADKTTNTFCVLTIHSGTVSAGSPEKDFAAEWNRFVVTPHKADANPTKETGIKDGWTVVAANAPIDTDGIKSIAFLVVYSG